MADGPTCCETAAPDVSSKYLCIIVIVYRQLMACLDVRTIILFSPQLVLQNDDTTTMCIYQPIGVGSVKKSFRGRLYTSQTPWRVVAIIDIDKTFLANRSATTINNNSSTFGGCSIDYLCW
jgi:hypothetical protein